MKKTILAILMAIVATSAVAAGTCKGGDPFEGVNDGHEYCISKKTMSWWAAFVWCQQQGRHLASLEEACGQWYGVWGDAACGNMVKSGVTDKICWTANPSGSNRAYYVNAGTGTINGDYYRNITTNYAALCY